MDGCFGYRELKALEELISASQGNSDPEDDLPQAGARKIGELKNFRDIAISTFPLRSFRLTPP